jgi:porin
LRAGIFDGVAGSPEHPGAFLAIRSPFEAGLLLIGQVERQLPGGVRAELGGWHYTAGLDALHEFDEAGNPLHFARDRGLYGLIEGPIHVGDRSSLAGWFRAGIGDPVVQRVSGYFGLGLVASGFLPSRHEDQAGFAINHAIVDDPSLPAGVPRAKHAETAFEFTYKTQLRDWLAIQPDLQYVIGPNGDPRIPNAVVLALRFSIALTHNFVRQISLSP